MQRPPKLRPIPGTQAPERSRDAPVSLLPDLDQIVTVLVIVRPRRSGAVEARQLLALRNAPPTGKRRKHLTRAQLAALRGASEGDVQKVMAYAGTQRLTVSEVNVAQRSIALTGRLGDAMAAFGATVHVYRVGGELLRGRVGELYVPETLDGIVRNVLGFDLRPVARSRTPDATATPATSGGPSPCVKVPVTPMKVARAYGMHTRHRGKGQCLGLIELNSVNSAGVPVDVGYDAGDLATYFANIGVVMPTVTAIGVAGGANLPGNANADMEPMLNIEISGAVANGADIAVYFAPNTDAGYYAVVAFAIYDALRDPGVVSNSWVGVEWRWGAAQMDDIDLLLQDAALLGVTFTTASGNFGSSGDWPADWDGTAHTCFPGTSPHALACGGTTLKFTATGHVLSEKVWNDAYYVSASGGGVSSHFGRPAYQGVAGVPGRPDGTPGRGVPDVAGNADYCTGYTTRWSNGVNDVSGGTSCVAPLFAAFITIINGILVAKGSPRAGFVNPMIYTPAAATSFYDIVDGNNDLEGIGVFAAGLGWDCCSGVGAPRLARFLRSLHKGTP